MHACPNTPASTHVVRLAMERAALTSGRVVFTGHKGLVALVTSR